MSDAPTNQLPAPAEKSRIAKTTIEGLALLTWGYFLIKLFVFDFDIYLMNRYAPAYSWILNFKFFLFLSLLTGIFLLVRTTSGLKSIAFIFFYPTIILFWRIPKVILQQKSWILVFAAINGAVNFFRSFKKNIAITTITLCSFAAILVLDRPIILSLGALALLISILTIYIQTILSAFKPSPIYKVYATALPPIREQFTSTFKLDAELRNIPKDKLDGQQLKVWASKLETPVLYNRVFLFVAKKFREYQQSSAPFVMGLISTLSVLFLTIAIFAFINLAIYKIDGTAFERTEPPTFFTFIWYSFNHLTANSIKELTPSSTVAKSAWMLESVFAFLFPIIYLQPQPQGLVCI